MVLSIEPCLKLPNNKILVHEECIVVTNNGYELLTKRASRICSRILINMDPNTGYNHNSYNQKINQ